MELYGYNPYYRSIPTRGGTSTGNMHSTIAFPGSNGRRGSLPVTSPSIGIAALTASPASITSPRVPNTPVVPNGAGPGGNGNGYDTSPKRPRRVERVIKPIKSVKGPDARGMEEEVQRLLASCEAHEARMKRTKANIEDRLFPELNGALSSLSDMDREADDIVAQLDETLASTRPVLAARLSQLVATHRAKVDDMEQKATPWRTLRDRAAGLLSEDGRDLSDEVLETEDEDAGGEETMPEEEREQRKEEGDEAALARVEGWAEEVKNYLTSEIAVLRIQKAARKKGPVWYAFWGLISTSILAAIVGFIVSFFLSKSSTLPTIAS